MTTYQAGDDEDAGSWAPGCVGYAADAARAAAADDAAAVGAWAAAVGAADAAGAARAHRRSGSAGGCANWCGCGSRAPSAPARCCLAGYPAAGSTR